MKRILAIIISFCMILSLVPALTATAEEYGVYVNGVQFTDEVTQVACGDGSAAFDAANATLTLTNATVTGVFGSQYGVINSSLPLLTIVLVGDNVLDGSGFTNDGIDAEPGCDVTVTGEGTLTLKDVYYGTYIGGWDKDGGVFTVKDTAMTVESVQATGIWANEKIVFENSDVTVNKTGPNYTGLVCNEGDVVMDGGTVTVTAEQTAALHFGNGDDKSHLLEVKAGKMTLSSGGYYAIKVEPDGTNGDINAAVKVTGGSLALSADPAVDGDNVPELAVSNIPEENVEYGAELTVQGAWKSGSFSVSAAEHEHDWGDWDIISSATCESKGTEQRVCKTDPTHVESRDIPATGHDWGEWKQTKAPTAVAEGEEERVCKNSAKHVETRAVAKVPFADVKSGAFYESAVYWALDRGVTNGIDDMNFGPANTCTRGQVVAFLWRAAGSPEPTKTDCAFTDVRSGAFYYKAMLWVVENGVTSGTSATTFAPNAKCTRGQVVAFLWRAAGSPEPTKTSHPFTDVKSGAFYYKAMLWAAETGVTSGVSATSFAPGATCTRGQVVTFLRRTYEK